ncbi:MAG: tetratricopeptide repeat protein, partial [Candidatus Lokiarchaeota archaeon]|nr:tetratricopeptide repeat protein [Candidatus Lokiarchaeota archaeon]
ITNFLMTEMNKEKLKKKRNEIAEELLNMGYIEYRIENYSEALICFDKVIEIDSNSIEAWYMKGKVLSVLKRHKESLECFTKAVDLEPDDYEIGYTKGLAILLYEYYKKIIKEIEIKLERLPNDIDLIFKRGLAFEYIENFEEAIYSYEKALELNPDSEKIKKARLRAINTRNSYLELNSN